MIYIASDHGGYKLKEHLKKFFTKHKIEYKDLGPSKFKDGDDYVEYGVKVAKIVSKNPLENQGILICRSGQGMCIVANKFKGIRAALVWNTSEAKTSRNDDMTNVLCLPADYISPHSSENIIEAWLDTPYSTEARHMRRVKKISELES